MARAVVSLGSNIEPERNIPLAIRLMGRCSSWSVLGSSRSYRSAAVGVDGPDFHNAAVLLSTHLDPHDVKAQLRDIEERMGRVRTEDRFAPRNIDLDLVLFEGFEGSIGTSRIPDPVLPQHAYLAVPAADVAPDWEYEMGGPTLKEFAAAVDHKGLEPVTTDPAHFEQSGRYAPEGDMEAVNGEVYDAALERSVREMLVRLGEDPDRDGLSRTPLRVAKAMHFLTSGSTMKLEDAVGSAVFESDADEMVLVKDLEFYSLCEHHMLPFFGKANVAYLPNKKIIGLSKVARIVDMFARRLQVQERLTNQIADAVVDVLDPHGVAVVMRGNHFCMMMRGVQKQGSSVMTSAMRGGFKNNPSTRAEFLELVGG